MLSASRRIGCVQWLTFLFLVLLTALQSSLDEELTNLLRALDLLLVIIEFICCATTDKLCKKKKKISHGQRGQLLSLIHI